uniref:Uncharacterized protein n=1 Tax=Triticum urartu TaxID=4572 RepID=A0A8R7UUH7_TRIUA
MSGQEVISRRSSRGAPGGDLSEPSVGHKRHVPQREGAEVRTAAGNGQEPLVCDPTRRVAPTDGELLQPAPGSSNNSHGGEADIGGLVTLEDPLDGGICGGVVRILLHDELLVEIGQGRGGRRGMTELGDPNAGEEREPAAGDARGVSALAAAGQAAQDLEEALVREQVQGRLRGLPLLLAGPHALGRRRGDRRRGHQRALPLLNHRSATAAEHPGKLGRGRDEAPAI